jgi:hypothetical protein
VASPNAIPSNFSGEVTLAPYSTERDFANVVHSLEPFNVEIHVYSIVLNQLVQKRLESSFGFALLVSVS